MKDFKKIKQLKELTGAGLAECVKALDQSSYDFEKAVSYIREKMLDRASSREGGSDSDGLIAAKVSDDKKSVSLIKMSSETDFVAKSKEFCLLLTNLLETYEKLEENLSLEEFSNLKYKVGTIEDAVKMIASSTREKVKLKEIKKISGGYIGLYIHKSVVPGCGKRVGVVVADCSSESEEVFAFLNQVAMQCVAAGASCVSVDKMDQGILDKEKEEITSKFGKGKEGPILEKIIQGKLAKFYEGIVLEEQKFIVNDEIRVRDAIKQKEEELSCKIKILDFYVSEIG
ncbi:MAG: translation elongation factor Ts [Gammaproteobacteria bacterium]|nr:translation elongation factor Ts [Gammaproteobacteria bacterium]